MQEPRKRCNNRQKGWLLERLYANKEIIRGNQAQQEVMLFWATLAEELNNLGCSRSAQQWQNIWYTWVAKAKLKARKVRRSIGGTGGGPAGADLTEEEMKILEIVGSASVYGFCDFEVGIQLPSNSLSSPSHIQTVAFHLEDSPPIERQASRSPPRSRSPIDEPSDPPRHRPSSLPRRRRRLTRPHRPPAHETLINSLTETNRLLAESIVRAAEIIAAALTSLSLPVVRE